MDGAAFSCLESLIFKQKLSVVVIASLLIVYLSLEFTLQLKWRNQGKLSLNREKSPYITVK